MSAGHRAEKPGRVTGKTFPCFRKNLYARPNFHNALSSKTPVSRAFGLRLPGNGFAILFSLRTNTRRTDMSLAISNYYAGLSTSAVNNTVLASGGGSKAAPAAGYSTTGDIAGYDTVQLSSAGRLAASGLLDSLILPAEGNVRQLSAGLSQDLGDLLANAGISPQPPIEFGVNAAGEIQVKGDRPDKEKILEVINGNDQVKEEIRTTAAISSHLAGIAESLKFQKEYLASNDPESVVAKYSYLFNSSPQSHDISLLFNGNGINVMEDGKEWLSSAA